MEDRRSRIRYELRCPVKMVTSQGDMEGETKNVSWDGALILCREPLAPEETFTLTIELPDGFIMDTLAEVVWSTASGPNDKTTASGMGVRFLW
jgi:hypothetical protein